MCVCGGGEGHPVKSSPGRMDDGHGGGGGRVALSTEPSRCDERKDKEFVHQRQLVPLSIRPDTQWKCTSNMCVANPKVAATATGHFSCLHGENGSYLACCKPTHVALRQAT